MLKLVKNYFYVGKRRKPGPVLVAEKRFWMRWR